MRRTSVVRATSTRTAATATAGAVPRGSIGFHGGKVSIDRPRVRARGGQEMALPSWETAQAEDWLGRWALNLMLINVSTRRFGRAVRLPEGDIPASDDLRALCKPCHSQRTARDVNVRRRQIFG